RARHALSRGVRRHGGGNDGTLLPRADRSVSAARRGPGARGAGQSARLPGDSPGERRAVRAALVLLVVGLGCGPGRVVRHGKVNEDAVAQVRRTLPDLRGLPFRTSVPALAMPPADIRAALTHEIDESYSPA